MTATALPSSADPVSAPDGDSAVPHHRIAILGAGFAGLGLAIKLKQAGIDDFVLAERDADVGGTWWANTYPGCQCDIPSRLYSFSFAQNPEWTRTYPTQPEIRDYLRDVADRFAVRDHIRFECEVTSATWDEERARWAIETNQGPLTADVAVAAPGPLSEPSIPELPGLERFEGTTFHTARWNHDHDLTGRRVAVVGTGASAIQAVPQIQPIVEHLDVFQRTPPWVVPHRDRPVTGVERRLYRAVPALQRLVRSTVYWSRELLVPGLVHRPKILKAIEAVARKHIERQVPDRELRARVTPDYTIGCKRILPSNEWYPAISQPNVDLVTEPITEVRPHSIVTADGTEHEVDTIIFATGFYVTDIPLARIVRGRDGVVMSDVWGRSPQAYRGTAVAGFPNLFLLIGPNTGLGHNSMVFMIESQLNYVMDALRLIDERGIARFDVRPEVQRAYNEELQERLAGTVWNTGGCSSWYLDAEGRNTTIWPDFTWRYWLRMRRFDPSAYALEPAGAPAPAARPTPAAAAA